MKRLVFLLSILVVQPTLAADVSSYTSNEGRDIVILTGDIAPGDAGRLRATIVNANQSGRVVSGVRLNSGGGNLLEGAKLADVIRAVKIATVVARGTQCASACFVAFAAGNEKFVSYQARVGVHGASDRSGRQSGDATVAMAKVVKEMGVPPAIIGRMVVTSPQEIVWLSPTELQSMGVKMTGKPNQFRGAEYGAYSQLDPAPKAKQNLSWAQIVESAAARSATGAIRSCQPELKICTTGILFRSDKNVDMIVRSAEDVRGKVFRREVCEFNKFGDNRLCVDFDTGQTHRDMKDNAGNWIAVGDD